MSASTTTTVQHAYQANYHRAPPAFFVAHLKRPSTSLTPERMAALRAAHAADKVKQKRWSRLSGHRLAPARFHLQPSQRTQAVEQLAQ